MGKRRKRKSAKKSAAEYTTGPISYQSDEVIMVDSLIETPVVTIAAEVEQQIWDLVANSPGEVGWLGSVQIDGRHLHIEKIYSFDQLVDGSFNSLTADSLRLFWRTMALSGQADVLNRMMFWGHSHGIHRSIPSGIDRDTMNSLFKGKGFAFMIMGIFNRHRDVWVSVYDYENNLIFDNIKIRREVGPDSELLNDVKSELEGLGL